MKIYAFLYPYKTKQTKPPAISLRHGYGRILKNKPCKETYAC